MSLALLPEGSASSTNSCVISPDSRLVRVMIDSPALMLAGMPLYLNFCPDPLYTGSPAGRAALPLAHPASASPTPATHSRPSDTGRDRRPSLPGCQPIATSSPPGPTSSGQS